MLSNRIGNWYAPAPYGSVSNSTMRNNDTGRRYTFPLAKQPPDAADHYTLGRTGLRTRAVFSSAKANQIMQIAASYQTVLKHNGKEEGN